MNNKDHALRQTIKFLLILGAKASDPKITVMCNNFAMLCSVALPNKHRFTHEQLRIMKEEGRDFDDSSHVEASIIKVETKNHDTSEVERLNNRIAELEKEVAHYKELYETTRSVAKLH